MITIIDYGVGNIRAFINIYKQLNISINIARTPQELEEASKIILPGVGAFDYAMTHLQQSGMRERLDHLIKVDKLPVLGICVGMQMLAETSDEGRLPGLGWIEGAVKKFDVSKIDFSTHLPHMGWNDVSPSSDNPLFCGLEENAKFYFLHSYYFSCKNRENSIAVSHYGGSFTCAVNHQNIYGVQFHPEKSHHYGISLLKNFAEL